MTDKQAREAFERDENIWSLARKIAYEQSHYDAGDADFWADVTTIYNEIVSWELGVEYKPSVPVIGGDFIPTKEQLLNQVKQVLEEAYSDIEINIESWQAASQQSGWQKISSAPKDGTEVLLYKFHYTSAIGLPVYTMQVASWQSGMWYVSEAGCGDSLEVLEIENPTHWVPLPNPPATQSVKQFLSGADIEVISKVLFEAWGTGEVERYENLNESWKDVQRKRATAVIEHLIKISEGK